MYIVFQKEIYNGILNATAWRVLRKRLHFTNLPSFKVFIGHRCYKEKANSPIFACSGCYRNVITEPLPRNFIHTNIVGKDKRGKP
jgi:hypothetical protein